MDAPVLERDDLFVPSRWPRKPYCSDDIERGLCVRSLRQAMCKPYIQANPPHMRIWSIYDVDREGAAFAWEDAGLPQPTWTTINTRNGHAHLSYGIRVPVLVASPEMRERPLRYLYAIEAAFRAALDGDRGYSGLITKNPAHSLWRVLYGRHRYYDLDELAEYVDLGKYAQCGKVDEVGVGRNVTLFDILRKWAYTAVRRYRKSRNVAAWRAEVFDKALERNYEFSNPLSSVEVMGIAKSVAKWVWARDRDAERKFMERQAVRGAMGGRAKGEANEDKRASARVMAATRMSSRAIANALGVHQSTVVRWLND